MVFRLIIVLFFFSVGAFSQEKYIKHSISKGENLTIIAKKYGIKPQDIERANPNAPKTLKLNSVLLIPNTNQKSAVKTTEVIASVVPDAETHKILAKETLWGISKKYKISVEDLKKANPFLETEGLKVGQEICIVPNTAVVEEKVAEEVVVDTDVIMDRIVLAKETKYAIAREFGITVGELEKQNPEIKGKLPVGYTLKIKVSKEKAVALEESKPTIEAKTSTEAVPVQVASETNTKKDTATAVTYRFQADLADQLINTATENIGIRYRSGGTSKAGFDCSGLMISTFNNFDIKLPRSSIEQSRFGSKINTAEAQKGDLIFFKTNGRRQINHVGMVVEVVEGEIKFVHSSTHGGVMISSTKEPYYQRAFTQVNRVLE
jgi:peptidoglycan endopeptidase LytE